MDFRAGGQAGGDDVLRHIPAHVSRAAIHFRRIFAGESAAAVTAHAAVAIHDNLAAGQTSIALRSADDETAGGVDQKLGFVIEHFSGQNFLDDFLDAEIFDLLMLHVRACCVEMTTLVMRTGLSFSYWTETWLLASGRSHLTLPALRMRVSSRPRRCANMIGAGIKFRRFIAGITEHQTLIAGALFGGVFAFRGASIHALGNVRALRGDDIHDENFVRMENIVIIHITDFADGVAGDLHDNRASPWW